MQRPDYAQFRNDICVIQFYRTFAPYSLKYENETTKNAEYTSADPFIVLPRLTLNCRTTKKKTTSHQYIHFEMIKHFENQQNLIINSELKKFLL